MSVVRQHIEHLDAMLNSVEDVLRDYIIQHSQEIVDLVKWNQLSKGKNSYGQPLAWEKGTGYYKPTTQNYAKLFGAATPKTPGAPYNFQWTGDTFDSMGLRLTTKSYEIFSIDGKQKLLESIYGEIFDLTKEHNDYVNKRILEPLMSKWIEENWWKI